jgi:hypothetical protein
MVIQVLAANPIVMSVRIGPPAQDAGGRDVIWKEIAKLVNAVRSRLCFVSISVHAMDGDDAENVSV